jgi:hypothetical protein
LISPITGKVVTASARITPAVLKLGSVCLDTEVDEPVRLVNRGTATLHAQPPTMEAPFAVLFVDPISYPETGALLSSNEEAVAHVRFPTDKAKRVEGKLTWDVDAPEAPFRIDATLDVKDAGTAVSPAMLEFEQVRIDERSDRRTIRLENCGAVETDVVVRGVSASRGSVEAWEVLPRTLQQRLGPGGKLTIEVRFAPDRDGRHAATIDLEVDGVGQIVELFGEALGSEVERDSLYGCTCDIPGAPSQGLPLAIVIVCALIPRRRTRSSAIS